eukprot:contig_13328_g3186
MTIIANVMWEMTAGTSAVNDQVGHLLIALTDVLKDLAFVDSRGFRRLEGLAGTLAAVEAISCAHLELNMNSSGFLENIVELVKVLTPVAASINESPGGLALLCKLATRTGNPAQLRWRGGHRAASPRWKRFGVLALEQSKTDAEAKRGGAKAVLRRAQFPIKYISRAGWQGDFQRWRWPASLIAIMEGTGLLIRDLIGLVDPDIGAIHAYPAVEFAQWPSVVPAQLLSRPLERDNGRVLWLVLREHPPRVLAFGICGQGMQYT